MISLVNQTPKRWSGKFAQYFDSLKTFGISCEITCYIQLRGHTCDRFKQTLELTFQVQLLRQNPAILASILVRKPDFDFDLLHRPRNDVETYTFATHSNVNLQLPSFTRTCGKFVQILHAWQTYSTWLNAFNHYCTYVQFVCTKSRDV